MVIVSFQRRVRKEARAACVYMTIGVARAGILTFTSGWADNPHGRLPGLSSRFSASPNAYAPSTGGGLGLRATPPREEQDRGHELGLGAAGLPRFWPASRGDPPGRRASRLNVLDAHHE
jgi:hypothetical protein